MGFIEGVSMFGIFLCPIAACYMGIYRVDWVTFGGNIRKKEGEKLLGGDFCKGT